MEPLCGRFVRANFNLLITACRDMQADDDEHHL